MEKRFRDYLRHLEKLDLDVISEEEIWEEREGLELKLTQVHQEMLRIIIPTMAFFICACIFLAVFFVNFFLGSAVMAAVMAVCAAYMALRYKTMMDAVKQLNVYLDKLNMRS